MRIYADTEFCSLWIPELISLALVDEAGDSLYLEVPYDERKCSAFTRDVVVPQLTPGISRVSRERARTLVVEFLGKRIAGAHYARDRSGLPELVVDFIGDWWILLDLVPNLVEWAVPRCAIVPYGAADGALAALNLTAHHARHDALALRSLRPQLQERA